MVGDPVDCLEDRLHGGYAAPDRSCPEATAEIERPRTGESVLSNGRRLCGCRRPSFRRCWPDWSQRSRRYDQEIPPDMLIAPALSNEMTLTNIDCLMQFTTAAAKLAGEVVSFLERGGPVIAAPRSQPDRLPEGLAVVVEPDNDADWLAALASDVPGRSSIGVTELARRNGGTLVRSGSKRL